MKILPPKRGKWLKMGYTPSPTPKWQWKTSAIAKLRSQDHSCYRECKLQRFYFLSQSKSATKRLKLTFPTTYFPPEQAISAIGSYRWILVTIHGTTDVIYTTIQCLQKHYGPDCKVIKEIQSQSSSHSSASSHQTIDSINERFSRAQRSTRKNFHAAIISLLATSSKRKDTMKILQPTEKRSQICQSINATLSKHVPSGETQNTSWHLKCTHSQSIIESLTNNSSPNV